MKRTTAEQDHKLMRALKVTEVSRVICDTNMGVLKLRIRKGEKNYRFLLDAVELPPDLNNEIFEIIYPPVVEDVYEKAKIVNFEDVKTVENYPLPEDIKQVKVIEKQPESKYKGRTKGSKNKKPYVTNKL